jgi:Sortase domain
VPASEGPSCPRLLRLVPAVAIPALATGGAVLALSGSDDANWRQSPTAAAGLARAAAIQGVEMRIHPGRSKGRPAPPKSISIPAAGVRAPVESVALRRGALRVPAIGHAGWYDGGPRPGEDGRAVIIGHLDTHRGPGLFARVPSLPPGTAVSVTDRRGETHRYNVIGEAQVKKDGFPTEYVYGAADSPVLVLITCGGPFVKGRGYRDNVLLYARAG